MMERIHSSSSRENMGTTGLILIIAYPWFQLQCPKTTRNIIVQLFERKKEMAGAPELRCLGLHFHISFYLPSFFLSHEIYIDFTGGTM